MRIITTRCQYNCEKCGMKILKGSKTFFVLDKKDTWINYRYHLNCAVALLSETAMLLEEEIERKGGIR